MASVPIHKALVVRLSSFGDVVLTEPVTAALKRAYPDAQIWFLTKSQFSDLPRMFEYVDHVLSFTKDVPVARLLEEVGNPTFELTVDLQNSFRSRLLTKHIRSRITLRYRREWFKRFVMVYMPYLWKGRLKHTVDLYSDALRNLGIESDRLPTMQPPQEALQSISREYGLGNLIGLCPGGSSPHKRWGEERFAQLADILMAGGWQTVIIGTKPDQPEVETTLSKVSSRQTRHFVENDFARVAALLSICKVVVTNDSGLMHLAAAVGTRVVAIFGPTSPLLGFSPLGSLATVVYRDLKCSPCSYHGNRPCKYGHRDCLESIEPQAIADVVSEMMESNETQTRDLCS